MKTFEVSDREELELASQVMRRLQMLVDTYAVYEGVARNEAMPHSELAIDDAATNWLQTSHLIKACMNLAGDNIHALQRLVFVDGQLSLPMHAHYPLLRAIIEAAVEVKWILEPDDHLERVQRSMRARRTELKWDNDLHTEVIESGRLYGVMSDAQIAEGEAELERQAKKELDQIKAVNDRAGLEWGKTAAGLPPYVSLLRNVGASGDVPGEFAASVWRMISGLSHPSASRATHYSSVEILETFGNVHAARVTASMRWTHTAVLVALSLVTDAVQLYRVRRTKPHTAEWSLRQP